jgi:uncharacterized membrane protein YjfL (UPF0719 family)
MSTCVRGEETCQWPLFSERLADTTYIGQTFSQYVNVILLLYIVLVIYVASSYYSIPYYLYERRYGNKRRKLKQEKLDERKANRAERKAKREARKPPKTPKGDEKVSDDDKDRAKDKQASSSSDINIVMDDGKTRLLNDPEKEDFPQFKGVLIELEQADNKAFAISYAGYLLGLCILLTGPRIPTDPSDDPLQVVVDQLLWGFLGIVLLTLNFLIQSKILLYSLDTVIETLNKNLFVAIVEASCFIGTSFNIRAVLSGSPGRNMEESVGATLLFYALGQIILIVFTILFQKVTPYDDQAEARKGNPAAGMKMGANIIALSILTSSPLEKTDELSAFFVYVAAASIFLFAFSMLLDKLLLPGNMNSEIENDQNWGLSLVSGAVTVSVAAMLDTMLLELPCPGTTEYDLMVGTLRKVDTSNTACYKCTLGERLVSTDYMMTIFEPWNLVFLVLIVAFMSLASRVYQFKLNRAFNGQTIEKLETQDNTKKYAYSFENAMASDDNKALSVSFAGYMVGTGLLTWSSFSNLNPSDGWMNVLIVIVWQLLGIVFLEVARLMNDKIALNEVNNSEEIVKKRNMAVGICEFGGYVGAGQIVMGATSGVMRSWGVDLVSALMFFVLGQIVFLLIDKIMVKFDNFDFNHEVKSGNAAIGVYYALNHITLGQLVSNCILKTDSILAFIVWFTVGTAVMIFIHILIHRLLLPGSNLQEEIVRDQNWGAAIVYGVIPLGVTVYINTFLPYTCENQT